jgi:hypothetical protein
MKIRTKMANIKLVPIFLLVAGSSFAQEGGDVIRVGINDQNVQIDPPKLNQKVSILIEDSTFDYKIEISKVSKQPINGFNNALNKVKEDYGFSKTKTSRWFNEIEVGINGLAFANRFTSEISVLDFAFDIDTFGLQANERFTRNNYIAHGTNTGFYIGVNLREKRRMSLKNPRFYFLNVWHLRVNQNFSRGEMFINTFQRTENTMTDSLVQSDTSLASFSLTNLAITKRLAVGYIFDEAKNFTLRYGLDIGLRALNYRTMTLSNANTGDAETIITGTDVSSFLSNPWLTFYYRFGVTYERFGANLGISLGSRRYGNVEGNTISGKAISFGLTYQL